MSTAATPLQPPTTWSELLATEREQPYFKAAIAHVEQRRAAGATVYPPNCDIFNAFAYTPLHQVRAVILGQDPYHGPGQAHGLCFSVRRGVAPPPSLVNIFKELHADLGCTIPRHGCLEHWAKSGVFLLNSSLTVEQGNPMSHATIGWQQFTDAVIQKLSARTKGVVYLLWGSPAIKKLGLIDQSQNLVLTAPHPSPLSAYRGFFGCKHFSQTNEFLRSIGKEAINWQLPE